MDLVLRDCKIVTQQGLLEAGIGIKNGKIKTIAKDTNLPEGDKEIGLEGKVVLPGAIDIHTHPGGKHPLGSDFKTETPGALLGGVTTVGGIVRAPRMGQEPFIEYAQDEDHVSWLEVFDQGKKTAEKNSCTDMFFTFTLTTMQHAREIPEYIRKLKVCTFKYHANLKNVISHPMGEKWAQRMALASSYDDSLAFRAMEELSRAGKGVLYIHCENTEISQIFKERLREQGRTDPFAWTETLPGFLEAEHIRRYSFFSRVTDTPLHIVHLTSKEGLNEVIKAKKGGTKITAETCPQYLLVDPSDVGFLGKLNPPLRKRKDREALWKGIKNGWIDLIGTDHVVSDKYEKLEWGDGSTGGRPSTNVWYTGSGAVGTQTMPILIFWRGVRERGLSLSRLAELISTNPAKRAGIYPKKGVIQVDSDADFLVIDQKRRGKISSEWLNSFSDFTLFEGMEGDGWPFMTVLRGEVVMREGELYAKPGFGKYVECL